MNGAFARSGFRYQDLYLLHRILAAALETCRDAWALGTPDLLAALGRSRTKFGIEAHILAEVDQPTWDVVVDATTGVEVIEVKAGQVDKSDRETFWLRLRKSATGSGVILDVTPLLVVDPEKSGALAKWQEFATHVREFVELPSAPGIVYTSHDQAREAVWWLCCNESHPQVPLLTLREAQDLLVRFQLVTFAADDLAAKVEEEIRLLFPDGLEGVVRRNIRDWLDERGADTTGSNQLFTLGEIFRELGMARGAMAFVPGTLERWRSQWRDWRALVLRNSSGTIGLRGESVALERAQPELAGVSLLNNQGLLLLGGAGSGKSTFLVSLDRMRSSGALEGVLCPAANLSQSELDDLFAAVSFRSALVREGERVLVLVDGLDEVESADVRLRWGQVLARLATRSTVDVCATMRSSDWQAGGGLQTHLKDWRHVTLLEWSEELVRSILEPANLGYELPPKLVGLLRTPIMLDLFWRAFVEARNTTAASLPNTRHQLLRAFWIGRVMRGRHAQAFRPLTDIDAVFAAAARTVGSFSVRGLSSDVVDAFESESVLVKLGLANSRLQFRHPLIRDFTLALWCLDQDLPEAAVNRWSAIMGGIQQQGALRAVLEALSDEAADGEFPQMTLPSFVQAVLQQDDARLLDVGRALGTIGATARNDPGRWPDRICSQLPESFGSEIVGAAGRSKNRSWLTAIVRWPFGEGWLRTELPETLLCYFNRIGAAGSQSLEAGMLARTIRRLSEDSRYSADFEKGGRWLKHYAIETVLPSIIEPESFEWVEREIPMASQLTRTAILSTLPVLAAREPVRAAAIYKSVVGLYEEDHVPVLDASIWNQHMEYDALDRSLTGPGGGMASLVSRHPVAFLPVAVELDEALFRSAAQSEDEEAALGSSFVDAFEDFFGPAPEVPRLENDPLADLINDQPQIHHHYSRQGRVRIAIEATVQEIASADLKIFALEVFPKLRRSRLASHHGILLQVLGAGSINPLWLSLAAECLQDQRIYHVQGLLELIETVLSKGWAGLTPSQRRSVLRNIDHMGGSSHLYNGQEMRALFLSNLPVADLSGEHRRIAQSQAASNRPSRRRGQLEIRQVVWDPARAKADDINRYAGEWPNSVELSLIKQFYLAALPVSRSEPELKKSGEVIGEALVLLERVVPQVAEEPGALLSTSCLWMWDALVKVLYVSRRLRSMGLSEHDVTSESLQRIATMVRWHLSLEPEQEGDPETGDVYHLRDTPWTGAVELTSELLVQPQLPGADALKDWFGGMVEAAYLQYSPRVQTELVVRLFATHWLHIPQLRELISEKLWSFPTHAAPIIRALHLCQYLGDADRVRIARLVLLRPALIGARDLVQNMGEAIGHWSLWIVEENRRSRIADLADEILSERQKFPLLGDEHWPSFLYKLAFGLKEEANQVIDRVDCAVDFARWNMRIWREMRHVSIETHQRAQDVALFAFHWLEQREPDSASLEQRRRWWLNLVPLAENIVDEGGASDLRGFFFGFQNGELNNLVRPEELLALIERSLSRIASEIVQGSIRLKTGEKEDFAPMHWREALKSMALTIGSLIRGNHLTDEVKLEYAHTILVRLSDPPLSVAEAKDALHRLLD